MKNISKTAMFTAATLLAGGYALAAQYHNKTTYAETHSDWFDANVWAHPEGYADIPNWTAYPDDNNTQCHVDLYNDLVIDKGGEAFDIRIETIWPKAQNKSITINSGITLNIVNGINSNTKGFSDKLVVNNGATLKVGGGLGGLFLDVNGGNANFNGVNGYSDWRSQINLNGGNITNTGQTNNAAISASAGEYITSGGFTNTTAYMTGGTVRLDKSANIQQGSTFTLLGDSKYQGTTRWANTTESKNLGESTVIDSSTINFGGGEISQFKEIRFQNNPSVNFGFKDEEGNFHAAKAHSIDADWKITLNGTTWKFNADKSNLIKSNADADLKTNAFAYATDEFQVYWYRGSDTSNPTPDATIEKFTLDFSNIDLTAVETGTYYLSLIAAEKNYHTYADPTFDFINEDGSTSSTIAMSTEYVYNDNLSFQVLKNSNSTAYYVQLDIVQVIPEPSTYAAIFGALALAFVAYRKK